MATDVIKAYGCRTIEGLDIDQLKDISSSSYLSYEGSRTVLHKPSGKRIALECCSKYFEPIRSYFRFNSKSTCEYIMRGLNQRAYGRCNACIRGCLQDGLVIKPKKVIIARNYFE